MATTKYVWVGDNVLYETDGADAVTVTYTYSPEPYGNLLSEQRGGVTYTHHYDAQGSTLALTDDTGAVTDTFRYTAWGEEVVRTGTTPTPFRWIGEKGYAWNESAGRYDVRRRAYGPTIARWLTIDPAGFLNGANRYAYALNSANNGIDPAGLFDFRIDPAGCEVTLVWKVKLNRVRCHAEFEQKGYSQYCPGNFYYSAADGKWYIREDWTDARWRTFENRFPGVIQGCWNNGSIVIKSVAACSCGCWGSGWKPRVEIRVDSQGNPDTTIDVAPNYPIDSEGELSIQSWTDRPKAFLDEADLDLWTSEEPYKQITACHEFGHMIGLKHPGPSAPGLPSYTGDPAALMGYGLELRPEYFFMWDGPLDSRYPECAIHLPEGAF